MAEYMEVDVTDYDVKHFGKNAKIPTYDKDRAEKEIARLEKKFGKQSEQVKANIRRRYRYIGEDKE